MRTPEQYRAGLARMKPNLYIGGEKVGRDDPRIAPGINVMAVTFEIAQDPKWKGVPLHGRSTTARRSIGGRTPRSIPST